MERRDVCAGGGEWGRFDVISVGVAMVVVLCGAQGCVCWRGGVGAFRRNQCGCGYGGGIMWSAGMCVLEGGGVGAFRRNQCGCGYGGGIMWSAGMCVLEGGSGGVST